VGIHGDIDIIPEGTPSRWEIGGADQGLILRIGPDLLEMAAGQSVEVRDRFLIRDPRIEHIGWALKAEIDQGLPSGRIYRESLATALAAHLVAAHSSTSSEGTPRGEMPRLRHVLGYIEEHLAHDLSLAAIASIAGLSVSHTKAMFRRATGLPIHQYVIRRRVELAARLLRHGSIPASQVALAAGFSHQSHMARHMRKLLGVTPAGLTALSECPDSGGRHLPCPPASRG
jgi:AraC family transcriptional regulator